MLTAILTHRAQLRRNEFSHEPRAGFCMMGACQDCWVQTTTGERLRSCATFIQAGMQLTTGAPVRPPSLCVPDRGRRPQAAAAAAQTLAAYGVRPVVIDEAARGGGQIYRRPPAHFARSAINAVRRRGITRQPTLHSTFGSLQAHIDYQPDSLVWNAQGGLLDVLHGPTLTTRTVPYGQLIVASGATDRVPPLPGWTLPGVYTLGGAQVALKFQGCTIGRNVVLMGTGPLLYLWRVPTCQGGGEGRCSAGYRPLCRPTGRPARHAHPARRAGQGLVLRWLAACAWRGRTRACDRCTWRATPG